MVRRRGPSSTPTSAAKASTRSSRASTRPRGQLSVREDLQPRGRDRTRTPSWPGSPARCPSSQVDLPATAIGKDYPGRRVRGSTAPSGSGFQFTLRGLFGVAAGPVEGFELNILGLASASARTELKLPLAGRVGLPRFSATGKQ